MTSNWRFKGTPAVLGEDLSLRLLLRNIQLNSSSWRRSMPELVAMLDGTSNGDSAPQKAQKRARHAEPDSRDKDALQPAKATQNGAASKDAKPSGAENAKVAAIKRECAPTSPTATECAKTDSSWRFPKPRKKGRAPNVVYFKDSLPMAVEGESLVGSVIRVWWDGNRKWFQGRVIRFQTNCPWVDFVQPHLIRYDDGEIRWHELEGKVTGECQTYPILVIFALLNSAQCSFIASPNHVLQRTQHLYAPAH